MKDISQLGVIGIHKSHDIMNERTKRYFSVSSHFCTFVFSILQKTN